MTYLVLRLSTLGNVAMSVPVIASLATRYPEHRFVVVSRKQVEALFASMPNVCFVEANFPVSGCKGIGALIRLYEDLRNRFTIDAVADLQDVWRTRLLRKLFQWKGARIAVIDKERVRKQRLMRMGIKRYHVLKHENQRYAAVFAKLGLEWENTFTVLPSVQEEVRRIDNLFGTKDKHWLGIAPFAKRQSNRLPYKMMKEVIGHFAQRSDTRVFLFGAGNIESEMLRQWATVFPNVTCVAGMLDLAGELELMRRLDLMLCMDSANQHLSSLIGLRALSIWGGTHPAAGFYGWQQDEHDIIQQNMPCRPCTINGTDKCRRKDFACLRSLKVETIIREVEQRLYKNSI